MDGVIFFKNSSNGHTGARRRGDSLLRLQPVHHPVGIVVERQLCPRRGPEALGRLVEGFVRVATAINNGAGPCSGIGRAGLCRGGGAGKERNGRKEKEEAFSHTRIHGRRADGLYHGARASREDAFWLPLPLVFS